ncbi:hypothetical protein M9H77_36293 [Catharanthus roseus]|uniref:Uncharacterized protein n=1 Tax=Catharanthus roseus TaxID=4058 RepID=A0ACB9ZTE0_CATRO|nr:hypothetical protein M9H77_36293 [Catharanthus roseus]
MHRSGAPYRGIDRGGCGPIGLCGHRIMLYGGVRPPSGESERARHRGWSQDRPKAALMCLDSLRLPSCAQNPHIPLERSGAPRATEVLGQEFLDQISPEGHIFMFYLFRLESSVLFYCGAYNLVPRGTQMPHSAAVDLVAGLGASQVVSEHLGSILGLKRWILDKL